jgi:hypothetical protein
MGGLVEPIPGHPEYLAAWDGTIFSAKTGKALAGSLSRGRRAEGKSPESARRIANAQRKPGQHSVQAVRRNSSKPDAIK